MLLSLFLTCFVALGVATVLLLGHRVRFAFGLLGLTLTAAIAVAAALAAETLWDLPARYVRGSMALIVAFGIIVVLARRVWNPIGQAFFAVFLAAADSYLVFGASTTTSPPSSTTATTSAAP
jgi:hypothetical protein